MIAPGILYSLLANHLMAGLQLLLVGGLTIYFGYRFLGNLEASRGTVTAETSTTLDSGRALGRELAAALGLSYEEGTAPY